VIAATGLELRAGAQLLLADATFQISPGDKVGLVLPAAREPVLGPAASRRAAVHQPGAGLVHCKFRRVASEHPGRVTAEPDQQDPNRPGGGRVHRHQLR